MASDYDPELEDVRGWVIDGRRVHNPFASDANLIERFDRWLAAHDAEQRRAGAVEALRAAADVAVAASLQIWLRACADEIEAGA